MSHRQATILVVDDDDGHCELVRRHLERAGINHPVVPAKDGRSALDFVFRRGPFVDRSPDTDLLVLLDINMPGIDGIEVLRQIKSEPRTQRIPVLMLTSTENPREVSRCYEYGCNSYIKKSVDATALIESVQENLMMPEVASQAVLIVEDHEITAELERRALVRAGTNTVIVARISHALELIESRNFAAILLDYQLPDGDPWAVVLAAQSKCPPIPVVLVTGQGSEVIASEAIKRGVADYVKKSGTFWDELPGILNRVTEIAAGQERMRISEANCRLMAEVADKANRAKSEYLACMSHEIRTPLTAVIGLGYLLEKTALTEDQREYIERIQLAGRLLLGVVNNVLDLSKIEAGEMLLEKQPFDPLELLQSLAQMLGQQAKNKGIELIVLPAASPPCRVKGDGSRLLQILVNLVSNSIKFTEAGRIVVKMTCTSSGSERLSMRCEVEDTGIGIEPQALERLFQPFSQADTTTTRRFGGTGLGLSISRALVELMGGSIGATSKVAVGSTFWFEIPFEAEVAAAVPKASDCAQPGAPRLPGVRALVVDDCDIVQEFVRRILEDQGAIVACCSDGAAAVQYVRDYGGQLDIVLIDVQMPILDGNAATRRIRGDLGLKTLPIIGLTAGVLLSEQHCSIEAGMTDVITKPFDPEAMVGEIQLLVGHAAGSRQGRLLT